MRTKTIFSHILYIFTPTTLNSFLKTASRNTIYYIYYTTSDGKLCGHFKLFTEDGVRRNQPRNDLRSVCIILYYSNIIIYAGKLNYRYSVKLFRILRTRQVCSVFTTNIYNLYWYMKHYILLYYRHAKAVDCAKRLSWKAYRFYYRYLYEMTNVSKTEFTYTGRCIVRVDIYGYTRPKRSGCILLDLYHGSSW